MAYNNYILKIIYNIKSQAKLISFINLLLKDKLGSGEYRVIRLNSLVNCLSHIFCTHNKRQIV